MLGKTGVVEMNARMSASHNRRWSWGRLRPAVLLLVCLLLPCFCQPAQAKDGAGGESVEANSNRLRGVVQERRGLKYRGPVKFRHMSLVETGKYLRSESTAEQDPQRALIREEFFEILGLTERGGSQEALAAYRAAAGDKSVAGQEGARGVTAAGNRAKPKVRGFESSLLDVMCDQVRGLYDPKQKAYIVVNDAPEMPDVKSHLGGLGGGALALMGGKLDVGEFYELHELEHALQDQNYDLQSRFSELNDNFDRGLAGLSLVEGDAVMLMISVLADYFHVDLSFLLDFLQQYPDLLSKGIAQFPDLNKSPLLVKEYVVFPYWDGLNFVGALWKSGGWTAVNRCFEKGAWPVSTEQILHPDHFLVLNDPPLDVDLSAMPESFGDYRLLGEDTGGEFMVRTLAKRVWGAKRGDIVGEGWGGDTWRIYQKGDRWFAVWATAWDSERDAVQFEGMANAYWKDAGVVQRRKDRVVVAPWVPRELAAQVSDSVWNMKVSARPGTK